MSTSTSPASVPRGQIITAYPLAYAIIGVGTSLLKDRMRLSESLALAARRYSEGETRGHVRDDAKAELEKTTQAIERITRSIAEAIVSDHEARAVVQDLRDKKEQLMRELRNLEENEDVRSEIREAIQYINSDLDGLLWAMLEHHPRRFARVLGLLFKPHSMTVESFWDPSVKGHVSTLGKRKAKVIDYTLQDDFGFMLDASPQLRRGAQR